MTKAKLLEMYLIKTAVLVFVAAMYLFLPEIQHFFALGIEYIQKHDYDKFRLLIQSYGIWAPVTSILLMVAQSLIPVVPGIAVTIANAWIFGWFAGAVYSWIGALLGAVLDFSLARWYGRDVVELVVSSKFLQLSDGFFQKHGVTAVFITRLTPVIPFKFISYGAGLTTISVQQYIVATGIGQTPGIIIYSVLGENISRSLGATVLITMGLGIVGIIAFRYRKEIEKLLCHRVSD